MHKFQTMRHFLIAAILLASLSTYAKISLNSVCYVDAQQGAKTRGENTTALFEVASVSKIFTSYWAIHKLGPYYRFTTSVHVTPVGDKTYDVHIQGGQDPFWGRQLTHFLFAELNRQGVTNIRRLTFDENFKTRWNVLTDFLETLNPSTDDISASFVSHIAKLRSEYPVTFKEAARAKIALPPSLNISAQEVSFVASSAFAATGATKTFLLRSSPLYRYLKEVNRVSNNHVADKIFDLLGGPVAFKAFVQKTMNASDANLQFVNGSGNSMVVSTDPQTGTVVKEYNKASCETIVRVLMELRNDLRASGRLDLKDIMAVASTDESTLSPRYDSLSNSIVAKTGTVDPAITLTGMISTAHGDVYFGVLYRTAGPADWNAAKDRIRGHVFALVQKFGGRRTFNYEAEPFLTFDAASGFTENTGLSLAQP